MRLGVLVYDPLREGPTVWEIGIPDRMAAEFYVPDPNPTLMNQLYVNLPDKGLCEGKENWYRQYGLWDRYSDIYPDEDLAYTVGISNYDIDWFFAQVNRNVGNKTYIPTTLRIIFDLDDVSETRSYVLRLAIALAHEAELQEDGEEEGRVLRM